MVQRPSQKTEDPAAEEEPLQGGIVRVDFCRVWIGMCEGANTCLMPGGDGLPEGAMFRNEDGKRFFTNCNKINREILKIRSKMHAKSIVM